jgi:hypothetical protein
MNNRHLLSISRGNCLWWSATDRNWRWLKEGFCLYNHRCENLSPTRLKQVTEIFEIIIFLRSQTTTESEFLSVHFPVGWSADCASGFSAPWCRDADGSNLLPSRVPSGLSSVLACALLPSINQYSHVYEWLQTGFGLAIGFIQMTTTSNYHLPPNSCTLLTTAHTTHSNFVFTCFFPVTNPNNVLCLLPYRLANIS